jgi:hypothetical protein
MDQERAMSEESNGPRPVIVYVDEDADAREDFLLDALDTELFADVQILEPRPTLDEMIDVLMEMSFEALVSDFRLADASPVEYNGSDLVDAFLERRSSFPCFIRTSFDNEALHAAEDVNRVYVKDDSTEGSAHSTIFERIRLQVARYRSRMEGWSAELNELLAIDRASLNAAQIDRVIELDSKLESYLGGEGAIPNQSKREFFEGGLRASQESLLEQTEQLVLRIRKVLND